MFQTLLTPQSVCNSSLLTQSSSLKVIYSSTKVAVDIDSAVAALVTF